MDRRPEIRYINSVVCGSCAYDLEERKTPKKRVQLPKARRAQKKIVAVDPASLAGIAVSCVLLVLLVVGFVRLQDDRNQTAALLDYVQTLQTQSVQLQEIYAAGYQPEEIERIALAMGKVPASEAPHISMEVSLPVPEAEPSGWEAFLAFLTGLFA